MKYLDLRKVPTPKGCGRAKREYFASHFTEGPYRSVCNKKDRQNIPFSSISGIDRQSPSAYFEAMPKKALSTSRKERRPRPRQQPGGNTDMIACTDRRGKRCAYARNLSPRRFRLFIFHQKKALLVNGQTCKRLSEPLKVCLNCHTRTIRVFPRPPVHLDNDIVHLPIIRIISLIKKIKIEKNSA
jgi:hypothetical protein